jgi:hypothetical protein
MKILQAKSEPSRLSAAPPVKGLVAGAAAANVGRTLKRAFRQLVTEDINSGAWLQGCPFNNLAQEMSPLDEGFHKCIGKLSDHGAKDSPWRFRPAQRRAR